MRIKGTLEGTPNETGSFAAIDPEPSMEKKAKAARVILGAA